VATFARIGAAATGLAAAPGFKALAPWIPLVCWALAAALAALAMATAGRSMIPNRGK